MSGGTPARARQRRLGVLNRHMALSSHPASLSVEEALRRLPGGDGPGDPGIPTAADPNAMMSVFILAGQSSMAGRGMLPEFQTLNPDILGASSFGLPVSLQSSPRTAAEPWTCRRDCCLPERRFLLPVAACSRLLESVMQVPASVGQVFITSTIPGTWHGNRCTWTRQYVMLASKAIAHIPWALVLG
eukprot:COSAG02_NODE_5966_length_3904_cov_4.469648_1_plen_187_part_00